MRCCLYILENQAGKYYIGSTNDLGRRLSEHERGQCKSTRHKGPWTLVHMEPFETLIAARRREYEIKRKKKKTFVRELIANHGSVV